MNPPAQAAPDHTLSPTIQTLVKDFELHDNKVLMPEPKLATWAVELAKVSPTKRHGMAVELLAVAVKFKRLGGPAADAGIAQLCQLAAPLLGGDQAAKEMFDEGLKVDATNKLTGSALSTTAPMKGEKTPGGTMKVSSMPNYRPRK